MLEELKELLKYKDLLRQLVVRDLKVRYKNSVLGFVWSLLNPLVQVATITLVIRYVMAIPIPNYSAYLLVGYIPWMYFQMALLDSSQVIIHHRDLIKKVYFPREALPLSAVIANLVHFVLAMGVFFCYLLFFYLFMGGSGIMPLVVMLPALALIQTLLLIGLSFIISCLNVFYEDTKYILTVVLNVLFYLTPIMYVSELVKYQLDKTNSAQMFMLYMLSPITTLIDTYRKSLLPPLAPFKWGDSGAVVSQIPINWPMLGVCAAISVAVAILGYRFFNARKWSFAERT